MVIQEATVPMRSAGARTGRKGPPSGLGSQAVSLPSPPHVPLQHPLPLPLPLPLASYPLPGLSLKPPSPPPAPLPSPPAGLPGGRALSAFVILIEFNCLLQVALKPFQSPLKLGNIDNTAPWGFNLCPP